VTIAIPASGDPLDRMQHIALCLSLDGTWHHIAVIHAGVLGLTETHHGAADRWDWSLTARDIPAAQRQHERLQALAAGLTPEQRHSLWTTTDPRAAKLRGLLTK